MSHVETSATLLERRNRAVSRGPFHVAPVFVTRASGSRVWDADGKEYIDFCGGIGVLNVGHNHPRVVRAIEEQSKRFSHTCWHVMMYENYVRLAERLNEAVPIAGTNKSVFFNSGAEAVENAVKLSRHSTGRDAVIAFERGFHGRTLLGMTLTGKVHPYASGFGPYAPEVYRLPYEPFFGRHERSDEQTAKACGEALQQLFAYHVDVASVACIVLEPVLGEGGFLPLLPAAARVLRETTRKHGIVLAADEIQTGLGRCGALFACERLDLEPDLLLTAKSLGGGLPLSGVTGKAEIMDHPDVGGIGGTFGGNPIACAAANAVLDVMRDEDLPARARVIGRRVMQTFDGLVRETGVAGDARGLGAMCGLEIVDPVSGTPDSARARQIVERCLKDGLLIMTASGNVLRTLMPLTIPDDELERALQILDSAVRTTQ